MISRLASATVTSTCERSLWRFFEMVTTGMTTSCIAAPPCTYRLPEPDFLSLCIDFGIRISTEPRSPAAGGQFAQAVFCAQAVPQREPAIFVQDALARDFRGGKVALLDRPVLIEKAVIGGDDDVAGVGARQLFHQLDDLFDRLLGRVEDFILGGRPMADRVDLVVIDVSTSLAVAARANRRG